MSTSTSLEYIEVLAHYFFNTIARIYWAEKYYLGKWRPSFPYYISSENRAADDVMVASKISRYFRVSGPLYICHNCSWSRQLDSQFIFQVSWGFFRYNKLLTSQNIWRHREILPRCQLTSHRYPPLVFTSILSCQFTLISGTRGVYSSS